MGYTHELHSFAHLAEELAHVHVMEIHALHHALKRCAELVENTARKAFGHQQGKWGWPALEDSTLEIKAAAGYAVPNDLVREGTLRDSLMNVVEELEAYVGFTDPKAVFHEFGTSRMPMRPILGPALKENLEKIKIILANAALIGFTGGFDTHGFGKDILGSFDIHPDLGYNHVSSAPSWGPGMRRGRASWAYNPKGR